MNLIYPIAYLVTLIFIALIYTRTLRNAIKRYEKQIKENQEVYSKLCCDLHDICKKSNESLKELTVEEIKNAHKQFIYALQKIESKISKKIESDNNKQFQKLGYSQEEDKE